MWPCTYAQPSRRAPLHVPRRLSTPRRGGDLPVRHHLAQRSEWNGSAADAHCAGQRRPCLQLPIGGTAWPAVRPEQTSCWRMRITSGICNDARHGSVWSLQAETGSTVSTALRVTARRVSSSRPSSTAPHRVVATSVPREPSCSLAGNGWEVQANIETNLMSIGMFLFDAGESGVGKLRRAEEASGLQSPTNSQLGLPPTVDLCPARA